MEKANARILFQGEERPYEISIKKGRSFIHIDCTCGDFRRGGNFCKHLTAVMNGDFSKVIDEENSTMFRQLLLDIDPQEASFFLDELSELQAKREKLEAELKELKGKIKIQKEALNESWKRGERETFSFSIKR